MGSHLCIAPGSINIDLILRTDILKGPKTFKGDFAESQGGKGCNEAVSIRRSSNLERDVYLVGCVGDDTWGHQALDKLQAIGVNTDYIKVTRECATGVVLEYLFADGEVTIGLGLGANNEMTIADVDAAGDVITNASILLTQIESPIEVVEHSLELARSSNVITFLDPSVVPEPGEDRNRLFERILPNVDIVAPNRSEALALTGVAIEDTSTALEAAEILLKAVDIAIITLGKNGALIARQRNYHIVPGIDVNSIDAGAAGDTFRGAFCEALAEILDEKDETLDGLGFEDLGKAAETANYAAALCVTRSGAYPSIPTGSEIQAFRQVMGQQ